MSDLELISLKKDNESLRAELQSHKTGVDGLLSQLDATKQMFNDQINASLTLRATNILMQKQNQELFAKFQESEKLVESLKNQLSEADARIASLEAPKDEVAA